MTLLLTSTSMGLKQATDVEKFNATWSSLVAAKEKRRDDLAAEIKILKNAISTIKS